MLKFGHPWLLLLLLLIPLYWLWTMHIERKRSLYIPHSRIAILSHLAARQLPYRFLIPALRSLCILFLVIAMAEPKWGVQTRNITNRGVDIVLAVDISGSMLAMDFAPDNRLVAAAKVASDFVSKRPNDRFALVAFSEYALTQTPLTFDQNAILASLNKIQVNEQASGTAIGMGLAKAVARLKDSKAKSRIIILITDGVNNTGEIDPISAANMAKQLGIKVYPIGVGRDGMVPFPYTDPLFGTRYVNTYIELDMATLNKIAAISGTEKAWLATDSSSLSEIMSQIDRLEKTTFNAQFSYRYSERFMPFLWLAFLMLLLEIGFRTFVILVLPE